MGGIFFAGDFRKVTICASNPGISATTGIVDSQLLDLLSAAYQFRLRLSVDIQMTLTIALAHSKTPPIGAKIMPTTKKSGRTVLGVRMGLKESQRNLLAPE